MSKRSNSVRKNRTATADQDNRMIAAQARRSGFSQRHTPPAGAPNDRVRADPTEPQHRA